MKKLLGLYIHIPFCRSKCAYCDFYSLARSESRMDDYVRALTASLRAAAPGAEGYAVDTVYFGGGTPSFLGAARLAALLETVTARYAVAPGAEITFEANPESARDAVMMLEKVVYVHRWGGLSSKYSNSDVSSPSFAINL